MTSETFNPKSISTEKIIDCDVCPILQSGGEPFSVIMGSIARVPEGGAMRLFVTFKPAPLFNVLGQKGFSHWIERGQGDDWVIWFYRAGELARNESGPGASKADIALSFLQKDNPELQTRLTAEGQRWVLDVRQLSPPEPMEVTLAVIEKLPKDHVLVQVNERIPQFLLPILEERGFNSEIVKNTETEVRIEIRRR